MTDKHVSGEEFYAISSKAKKPTKEQRVTISVTAVVSVIIIVSLLVVSFLLGDSYGRAHAKLATPSRAGLAGSNRRRQFRGGDFGTVTAVSNTSISVQNNRSGTINIYHIAPSTQVIENGQSVNKSSIKNGDMVIIRVTKSGSTTASIIAINSYPGCGYTGGVAPGGTGGSSTTSGSNTISQ